jgi:hypothetical protein
MELSKLNVVLCIDRIFHCYVWYKHYWVTHIKSFAVEYWSVKDTDSACNVDCTVAFTKPFPYWTVWITSILLTANMQNVGFRNKRRIMLTLTLTQSLVLYPQACCRGNIKDSKGVSRRTGLRWFCEWLRDVSRSEYVARSSRIINEKWFGKAVEGSGNGLISGICERDWAKPRHS